MYKNNIDEGVLQNNFNKNDTKRNNVFKLSNFYLNNISYNTRKINNTDFLVKNKMKQTDKNNNHILVKDIVDTKTPVTIELFHQNSEKIGLHKERDFVKNDIVNDCTNNKEDSSDVNFSKHNITRDFNLGSHINDDINRDSSHFLQYAKEYNIDLTDNSFVKQHMDISIISIGSINPNSNANVNGDNIHLTDNSFVKQHMDISIISTNETSNMSEDNSNNEYLNIKNNAPINTNKNKSIENKNCHEVEVISTSHFIPIDRTFVKNTNSNVGIHGFIEPGNFKSSVKKTNRTLLDLHLKKIKVINNVYQEKYFGDVNATGFGDFIRGCYFLMSFCETYRFSYRTIINHPIQKFLKHKHSFSSAHNDYLFKNISMFTNNNWIESIFDNNNYIINVKTDSNITNDFINYIYDAISDNNNENKNVFIYTIAFPIHKLLERHKKYMRALLVPSDEMKSYIDNVMNNIGLIKKKYVVVHVRSGDKYLKQETTKFLSNYVKNLIEQIRINIPDVNNNSQTYLLISDNNQIKNILIHELRFLKTVIHPVTHLGEGVKLNDDAVKSTLLDFYLFSHSSSIMSFSSYKHGSGFSYWCSKTYDLPYSCKFVE
jgi:hypothetical protein